MLTFVDVSYCRVPELKIASFDKNADIRSVYEIFDEKAICK